MEPIVQYPSQRLDEIVNHCKARLQVAMDERVALGMGCPDDFEVRISIYASRAAAHAHYNGTTSGLNINIIPTILSELTEEEQSKAQMIFDYFDYAREVFSQITQVGILDLIRNPDEFLESINSEYLKELEEFFAMRGTPLETYLVFFKRNAKPVRRFIGELLPKSEDLFLGSEINSLRHELDHIDYHPSQKYQEFFEKFNEKNGLERQVITEGKIHLSSELARANMEVLELDSDVNPEMEIRARFFSEVPIDGWSNADLDAVAANACLKYVEHYVNSALVEDILGPIMSQHWASGEITEETMRATSNYVYKYVNEQRNHPGADRYQIDMDKVDFELAETVLNDELPMWQEKYLEKASFYANELKSLFSQKEDS